jgi:hypothetical protein
MFQTLFLTSCLLATSTFRGPGPASANHDMFTQPRVGLSTKTEVFRMWGQPASQRVEKDHSVCTWTRYKDTCVLTFNDKLDLLVDYRIMKR